MVRASSGRGSGRSGSGQEAADLVGIDLVRQRLTELTKPTLEKYGREQFDELVSRLEQSIHEFNDEVKELFTTMVDKSKEDHGRLKALLSGDDETEETETEPATGEPVEEMSEYEKKLEKRDATKKGDNDSEAPASE